MEAVPVPHPIPVPFSTPINGSSYLMEGLSNGQNAQAAEEITASIAQAQAISAGILFCGPMDQYH